MQPEYASATAEDMASRQAGEMLRIATDEASTREEAALTSREYTIQRGGGPAAPMTPGSSSNAVPARNHKFDGALALLKRWTLMRYVNTRPAAQVQALSPQMSVGDALKVLAQRRIVSAPVFDDTTGEYFGFLSSSNAVNAFLAGIYPGLREATPTTVSPESRADELAAAGAEFCERSIRSLHLSSTTGRMLYKAQMRETLLEVIAKGFFSFDPAVHTPTRSSLDSSPCASPSAPPLACHKVAVFDLGVNSDEPPSISAIISLTDLLRFLWIHSDELGPLREATVDELGLCFPGARRSMKRSPVTVPETATAVEALALMACERVSAIGVVSQPSGRLVASLSSTDVRGITTDRWGLLGLPVLDFIVAQYGERTPTPLAAAAGGADPLRTFLHPAQQLPAQSQQQQESALAAAALAMHEDVPGWRQGDERNGDEAPAAAPAAATATAGTAAGTAAAALPEHPQQQHLPRLRTAMPGGGESSSSFGGLSGGISASGWENDYVSVVAVRPTATFQEVLDRFNRSPVHHVWVVDADYSPVSVITPTDLLQLVANEFGESTLGDGAGASDGGGLDNFPEVERDSEAGGDWPMPSAA